MHDLHIIFFQHCLLKYQPTISWILVISTLTLKFFCWKNYGFVLQTCPRENPVECCLPSWLEPPVRSSEWTGAEHLHSSPWESLFFFLISQGRPGCWIMIILLCQQWMPQAERADQLEGRKSLFTQMCF